jgi:flagellar biosynthetic protein FliS
MSLRTRANQSTQVATASPERVLLLLLESAAGRIRRGIELQTDGKQREATELFVKANDIVLELERTLRPQHAPELCVQLAEIYQFVVFRLTRASAGDTKAAAEAEVAFLPIVEAFREIIGGTGSQTT